MPGPRPHVDTDRAKVTVDHGFSLRNYQDNGASSSSDSILAVTPSFQVSSFDPTNSILTSRYYTDIHTNRTMREDTALCTQIFIRNIALFKTIVLQVDPSHSINDVKVVVRAKIGFPNAEFDLLYKRILGGDQSLQFHGIPHNFTLDCISFRSDRLLNISIASDRYLDHEVIVDPGSRVWDVTEQYCERNRDAELLALIWNGEVLDGEVTVSELGIESGDTIYTLVRDSVYTYTHHKVALSEYTTHNQKRPRLRRPFWKAPFGIPWELMSALLFDHRMTRQIKGNVKYTDLQKTIDVNG